MTDNLLNRILIDQKIMIGKPIVRGTRLTVQHVLALLAGGMTQKDILLEHPQLAREDVQACLLFAMKAIDYTSVFPLMGFEK